MLDASRGAGQCSQGARLKTERVAREVVIVEDAPGPADHGVGVNVRRVIEVEFVAQPVPNLDDRGEVIQAEGIGRPHRGHDRRDLAALLEQIAQDRFEQTSPHLIFRRRRNLHDVLFAESQPTRNGQAGIVSTIGADDDRRLAHAGLSGAGARFLKTDLHAVQQRAGPAEREDAARLLDGIANQFGGHRCDLDLRHGDSASRFVAAQVRVVN